LARFFVLGPLEVRAAGKSSQVSGSFQAILLFALLLNHGRYTSADELMREVWGHGHPHKPENALQAHISRLRRSLRDLEPGRHVPWLASHASGYRLLDDEIEEFDGRSFAAAVEGARDSESLSAGRRRARLRDALRMWRGPVLGGITGGPICQSGVRHLEDLRLSAYQLLFDAELELGNHAVIISEISELATTESPFQERYCEQYVIALCRSGRHADALEVCRGTWYGLVRTGSGSRQSLRYYEHAILSHDPVLNTPRARMALACP
jgi:SARP family transcriptional regulator, regulator of embCAB operon